MPVVTLYFNRISKMLGRKVSKEKIISTLPFLGLDIEEETSDHINVEYSPNRPDFSTDYGVVTGLQGLLEIKLGMPLLKIKKGKNTIKVDSSVGKIRPYVVAIEAIGGKLDDETIRQIITMQEDLHNGIGRRRKKVSIGIHDLDKIKFPLVYKAVERTHRFVPLNSQNAMAISEILEKTETGVTYKHLLESNKVPIIMDLAGNTISFPPIINSKLTEVTSKSKNLLVEVTANDKNAADDVLAVVAYALQNAGFKLHSVRILGPRNSTPKLESRKMLLDPALVNGMLGLDLTLSIMIKSLRKNRLDAKVKGKQILCLIPRYRTDIFGPIDLVEEVALGYGIEKMEYTIPPAKSAGQKNKTTVALEAVRDTMIGLGCLEVMNFGLVGKQTQYDMTKRDSSGIISVADSKSQEHQILRDMILPGLIDTLSRNIHEPYPQKIFETGTVFHRGNPIHEEIHLACASAYNEVSYTEIKSVLQSLLKSGFDIACTTKNSQNSLFIEGRTADILVNGKMIGTIGELSPQVLDNFKMRVPVAGFEIKLTGLIFD
ncbi:MAG TPA: phenylalanine--tRNA ligase subunit beta [Candidatus Nitrosotalea sp.]|nr:phenylalanine--tRNA ligase subunit beta [Candidatus Nitrosotalea sp.]